MRSEIPQIQVITAITDSDCEDYVAQLLFSQGWSIIYRAFDFNALTNFLNERGPGLRTVLIYKTDLPGFDEMELNSFNSATITMISLDGIPTQAHELMTCIRGSLRLPLIVNPTLERAIGEIRNSNSRPAIVSVTGTTGAPGRSTIAMNLANYLSFGKDVQLIDADLRAPSLEYLAGGTNLNSKTFEILQLETEVKPIIFPEFDLGKLMIVDLGALPPVEEFVSDRRWQAGIINKFLEASSTLIYVTKATGLSLIRLESFLSQFHLLAKQPRVIFLLNQLGRSREDRALENRFLSIVGNEHSFLLPKEYGITDSLSAPQKRRSAFTKEIDKISQVID